MPWQLQIYLQPDGVNPSSGTICVATLCRFIRVEIFACASLVPPFAAKMFGFAGISQIPQARTEFREGTVVKCILKERERPMAIRCDNGPEFNSRHFLA